MKKALIITYYWPPMGGGGVQRWLKFVKYMRDFGWEPIVYTPKNADVANFDQSLESQIPNDIEVIRTEIWEPFDAYKKVTGKSKDEKIQPGFLQESNSNGLLQKISVWIRGNLFIPDAKKFWIKPSVDFLSHYIKSNEIDVVISTGPPHTNHLIARNLKRKLGVKWVADFRDPWTNIDYYAKLMLTSWADKKHHRLEKSVVREADEVVTVSWSWADDFARKCGRKPVVITNGYDPDDFLKRPLSRTSKQLTITHIGSLNSDRNPHGFWKALSEAVNENGAIRNIKIEFIGPTDKSVFEETKSLGLSDMISHTAHLPHKQVLEKLIQTDVLLLPLNDTPNIDGVVPGKLYEYLASRRPVIMIGKTDGDAAKILSESKGGKCFHFNDWEGIKLQIQEFWDAYNTDGIKEISNPPEKFSRKTLTSDLCSLLNQIISN